MMQLPLAYMNPGTGSLLLQVVLMSTAMVVLSAKSFWQTLRSFWTRKK
ncbi:MAG: hypothetical protein HYZ90_05990 [Candidatus Omnitrophica bacterium]|nr:hypothetical protein [Candidatus Omnitrophota bacterium]